MYVIGERGIIFKLLWMGHVLVNPRILFFCKSGERLLVHEKIPRNDILTYKYARIGILWKMDLQNIIEILVSA